MALVLVLVTMVLYWPATRHGFINYDDDLYVTANVHVQNGLTWENLKWAFWNPVSSNWHPLTMLSHMADCQFFGLKPWGHHLTSVLLHALNTALVFLLLRRLTGTLWRSVVVAALFGWHPLHVESVAWVAERKDVLSTFFGLLSLLGYARYAAERNRPTSNIQHRTSNLRGWYWLALVALALGLMSKPMLVTWPCVMLLLDFWPLGRFAICDLRFMNSRSIASLVARHSSLLWEKLPFVALAAAASVATIVAQKSGGALEVIENLPPGARLGNVLISYCRYLGKLFWPSDLACFYPHPGYWPLAQVLLAGGLLTGISAVTFVMRRRQPFMLMGWLWFVGTLVPVIGLVQVGGQAMADRYTYIPSLGVLILVLWGAYTLIRRWRHHVLGLSVAGAAAILACLALTRQQLGHWRDSETLFRHALAATDNNHVAHNNLGGTLIEKDQIDEAILHLQQALRLQPDLAPAHYSLGNIFLKRGQVNAGIRHYQEAIRRQPDYVEAHNNLGAAFDMTGQLDEAASHYQEVIRLQPDVAAAHYNLGIALARKGWTDEAIRQYQVALRLQPEYAEARNNLGIALIRKGRPDEAIRQFQKALRLKPDYADARKNLAASVALREALHTNASPAMPP